MNIERIGEAAENNSVDESNPWISSDNGQEDGQTAEPKNVFNADYACPRTV